MMEEMFAAMDRMFAEAMSEMDGVMKKVDAELSDLKRKVENGEVKVRNFVIKDGKLVELPMVPTTDRIAFTKKPERTENVATTKPTKKPQKQKKQDVPVRELNRFTNAEQKRILALRKQGKSIKAIAKSLHRDDKAVSAFVRNRGL